MSQNLVSAGDMLAVASGGPRAEDVRVARIPKPPLGPDDVLIRVDAAGLNPYDLGLVTGRPRSEDLAYPPGRDLAGTVVVGPPDLLGAQVWATGGELGRDRAGFHAEYVALPLAAVRRLPSSLTATEAATVGVAFTTAWWALTEATGSAPSHVDLHGQRILVTGAAGAVGAAAMQLSAWLGSAVTWGMDRSVPEGRSPGAAGIWTDVEALSARIIAAGGTTTVIDTVGAPLLDWAVAMSAPGGRLVTMSTPGDGRATFDLRTFYRKGLRLLGLNTGSRSVLDNALVLERLQPGFEGGHLVPPSIDSLFPLSEATSAYQRLEQRPSGKVVLVSE